MEEHSRVMNISQKVRTGVLFMIDLAGSERAANTQVCICVHVCGYIHLTLDAVSVAAASQYGSGMV